MSYEENIASIREQLFAEIEKSENPRSVLRHKSLRGLYSKIKDVSEEERSSYGQAINQLKSELEQKIVELEQSAEEAEVTPIDITAPFDINIPNTQKPKALPISQASVHPVNREIDKIIDIFGRMGFDAVESRQLDDDYHMFSSLNFPEDHPARDDYDTFMTEDGLIAPAHTSVMQNRILKEQKEKLEKGEPIAAVIPGKVFRNEDVDARHEHTFHQVEGIYVSENVTVGNLIATFKTFLETYYEKELSVRVNPFYFPFTEPSFEFSLSCPFCETGCQVCSYERWIELLGMGMIHPNVLREGGIDPEKYTGFAWGMGVERLIMMKYDIEDVRLFQSANLNFLRQFGANS